MGIPQKLISVAATFDLSHPIPARVSAWGAATARDGIVDRQTARAVIVDRQTASVKKRHRWSKLRSRGVKMPSFMVSERESLAGNRVTRNCWYQRQGGAVGVQQSQQGYSDEKVANREIS